jgi:hypothetical protein
VGQGMRWDQGAAVSVVQICTRQDPLRQLLGALARSKNGLIGRRAREMLAGATALEKVRPPVTSWRPRNPCR